MDVVFIFIKRHETAINEIYCVENGIVVSFFFHVVRPLTISSFLASPSICRRCVYLSVPLSKDPKSPPPLKISDANENPFSRLSLSSIMSTSLRIPSSSGSHSDWTISELPHSLLYSNTILESWWDSKTWSGIVCNRQMIKGQNFPQIYWWMIIFVCTIPLASILGIWHCWHGGSCPGHFSLAG